ncbi:MAG: cache domain-containing protein [Bryobacterales bacterium]|nr:cache domain-containing protein [Bryobacterales bacterium]MDE0293688.1 cache domain-containing protein [Bryobacterales bacterium]MDE0434124.1 cache domain-containing protein [Bryobacterales bacterium]
MRRQALFLSILLTFLAAAPALASHPDAEALTCADRSVSARAVRTTQDVQAFVQCAYEFVQEMGFEEARRAFHKDKRWKRGPIYVFVSEVTPMTEQTRSLVFPPDPSREGAVLGELLLDAFGNNYYQERHRILSSFGEGWIYYAFTNPATGRDEPKASYVKSIDWDGIPAAIGSGIYRRDIPGSCNSEEVNAMGLEDDPSDERLQEFVRCAAMELESKGYFATIPLATDPRWKHGSIYLFGVDTYGGALFSGDPDSGQPGAGVSELNDMMDGPFGGRDVVSVGDAFGETLLYYTARNPASGEMQDKVTFVKRVVVFGLPVLIGAGYYSGYNPRPSPFPF